MNIVYNALVRLIRSHEKFVHIWKNEVDVVGWEWSDIMGMSANPT